MNNSQNPMDANAMQNIKNMVDNGDLNGAISQISPEMIQNFSKMFAQTQNQQQSQSQNYSSNERNDNTNNNSNNSGGFDFSNLDMNTIMKMSSALGQMNNNNRNDPRANLLNSLKPYLRDGKKDKLDNYVNLLNMAKVAEVLKNNPNFSNTSHNNNNNSSNNYTNNNTKGKQ